MSHSESNPQLSVYRGPNQDVTQAVRRRQPTIVVARKYGQLGNCLYLYAHLIATAAEHQGCVINPAFGRYAKYFRNTAEDPLCRYPAVTSSLPASDWMRKVLYQATYLPTRALTKLGLTDWPRKIYHLSGEQQCDLEGEFAEALCSRGRVYVQGWLFRAHETFARHSDEIRRHLRPIETHDSAAKAVAKRARRGDVLVGVHIRQGDYRTFQGGRYYYALETYLRLMRQARQQLAPRNVTFLICSDSTWKPEQFPGLAVTMGSGHLVEDMYALAQCDLIVGPPSTFSGWASFYGETPLYRIESSDADLALPAYDVRKAS